MKNDEHTSLHERWARLRFAVVGPLLADPPKRGELARALRRLAERTWKHPTTGERVRFAFATIERWYYEAKNEGRDPVGVLRRRPRSDAGGHPSFSERLREVLRRQYEEHPGWSYRLHADNLEARVKADETLGRVPSYDSIRRYMRARGMVKVRPLSRRRTEGEERAAKRLERREVRSYEAEYVNGLWHLDYHQGSRKVLTPEGSWKAPHLLGVLDDRSRLCCHAQWYLAESAKTLAHGLSQAFQKRNLPRAALMDNGAAMVAAEIKRGLSDLGVLQHFTLPASAYQNGKQESWWTRVEGRLLPMLEGVEELTLALLNEATQAFVEFDYHRTVHSGTGQTPLDRFLKGPDVGRESPPSEALRQAFRLETQRIQRRSDGTVSIENRRFEVPSIFRHVRRLTVRYARWDLAHVDLVDERTGEILCPLYPQDKAKNADGRRRRLEVPDPKPSPKCSGEVAPLLSQWLEEQAQTGLPPAYLPPEDEGEDEGDTANANENPEV
jgi:transposase InsO family protein